MLGCVNSVLRGNVQCGLVRRMSAGPSCKIVSEVLKVEDKTIHVVKKGSGPATVLLMPGALGTAKTDFGPQLQGLDGDKFTVIGWDPPGYGDSRPPERNFENFFHEDARLAGEVMAQLGAARYSLLGWSDGGITALILAAARPDTVEKLVVWGANSYVCQSDIDMITRVADVSQWSPRMRQPMEAIYGAKFPALWAAWVQAYRHIYASGGDICSGCLGDIAAPTLVIHGSQDVMVAEEHVHYMADTIKRATKYVWQDGKHNLHLKHAAMFNEMVSNFILQKH